MMDAPFVTHPWVSNTFFVLRRQAHIVCHDTNPLQNYTHPIIDEPQTQYFSASLQAQQYASGGIEDASARAWLIVLILVFVMNVGVLIYFIVHRGLVTDFSEPPNLFALAVNSPPSHVLAGSCGGGPEGKQYMVNWFVNHEGNHLFMEPGEKSALLGHGHASPHTHGPMPEQGNASGGWFASATSAVRRRLGMKDKPPQKLQQPSGAESLRPVASRPVSMVGSEYELQEGYERTRKNYAKLANRRSML